MLGAGAEEAEVQLEVIYGQEGYGFCLPDRNLIRS